MGNAKRSTITAELGMIKASAFLATMDMIWIKEGASSNQTLKMWLTHFAKHGKIVLVSNAPLVLFLTKILYVKKWIQTAKLGTNSMDIAFHVIRAFLWRMATVLKQIRQVLLILCAKSMIGRKRFVWNVQREALRASKEYAQRFRQSAKLQISWTVRLATEDTSWKTVNA